MSWQILTVISVLGLSISIVLQRILLHGNKINPYAYAAAFQAMVGLLLTIVAVTVGFKLPGIEAMWLPVLISAFAYGIGHIVYAKTLQKVEASAFSVYFATHAIWMMVFGVLLFHEQLTWMQLIGALLIFAGVLVLVKRPAMLIADRGAVYGLVTGVLFGIAITAWAYVGRHTDTLSWAAVSFLLPVLVVFLVRPKTTRAIPSIFRNPSIIWKLVVLAFFYGCGSLAMLYAYKEGSLTVISPLRQTGIIVTTFLALLFISSERHDIGRKLFAAMICFVGVVMLVM
jgi:drug/metabolite transporter (DMT)-like permease